MELRRSHEVRLSQERTVRFKSQTVIEEAASIVHREESRRISASYTTGGPLTSHPTTAYQSVYVSGSKSPGATMPHPTQPEARRRPVLLQSQMASARSTTDVSKENRPLPPWNQGHVRQISGPPLVTRSGSVLPAKKLAPLKATPAKPAFPIHGQDTGPSLYSNLSKRHRDSLDLPVTQTMARKSQGAVVMEASPTPQPKQKVRSGIPKARTLNVLSNITASLSRTSLVSNRSERPRTSRISRHASVSSTATNSSFGAPLGPAGGGMASSLSPTVPENDNEISFEVISRDPRYVYTSQSSQYWCGRFIVMNDRMLAQHLPENGRVPPEPTSAAGQSGEETPMSRTQTASRLPQSGTMPSLGHRQLQKRNDPPPYIRKDPNTTTTFNGIDIQEEDLRFETIFYQLEMLCMTAEARKSLHRWQQAYARRVGKESLLPSGGSMDDRSWVGRFLSHSTAAGKGLAQSATASTFGRRKRSSLAYEALP